MHSGYAGGFNNKWRKLKNNNNFSRVLVINLLYTNKPIVQLVRGHLKNRIHYGSHRLVASIAVNNVTTYSTYRF